MRPEGAKRHKPNPEYRALKADEIKLVLAASGHLEIHLKDEVYPNAAIRRCFPLTHPDSHYALLDEKGVELGLLENPAELDEASKATLERYFKTAYLAIKILRIKSVEVTYGITTWHVETDHGARTFIVRDRGDIRFLADSSVLFSDVDGLRYIIEDQDQLDSLSRQLLEEHT